MKVLFVYPDVSGVERYGARKYYHGLGYLSAVAKKGGHRTSLIYLQQELRRDEFLAEVDAHGPDLVGFSSTTHQHPYVEQAVAWLKEEHPDMLSISGGVHPTLAPEQTTSTAEDGATTAPGA